MPMAALFLSAFLNAAPAAPAPASTDPAIAAQIAGFLRDWQSRGAAASYEHMSQAAHYAVGLPQLAAYLDSRRRVLGAPLSVKNIRPSAAETESGFLVYEADLTFEKGVSPAWFVLTRELAGWRIVKFGFNLPAGITASPDEKEILPVVHEMATLIKTNGTGALANRLSKEALEYSNLNVKSAREMMTALGAPLGALNTYTLNKPEKWAEPNCWNVTGEGTFQYGSAGLHFNLCWDDGTWSLNHVEVEAHMTPLIAQRTLTALLENVATVSCPHDAAFPVGSEIRCTITVRGKEPRTARVLRTSESGIKVVGIDKPGS
ncbi:MAG: hypothetical protein QOK37_13 [Thermoanaerobaculia bacterium]|nr:hypothetical protein [Thermoanaerobaculia bacterium]